MCKPFSKHGCFLLGRLIFLALILAMTVTYSAHAQVVFDTPSVDFGQIEIGNSSPSITVDLQNISGRRLTVSCTGGATSHPQFSGGQACQGRTLNPGETCSWNFTFTPVIAGALTASSNPSCNSVPLSVSLVGEGVLPKLVFDRPAVDFGPVTVGTTSPLVAVNLLNQGSSPVTVSCAGGAVSQPQFSASQACQGLTLSPGDSCAYSYKFTPNAIGDFSGSSNLTCNGVSVGVQLQGEGRLPALVVDTPAVDFGTVEVNTSSSPVFVDLRNQGPDPVTISCAGGAASPSQFSGGQACQGSTLNTGETCHWSFYFSPNVPGEVTGSSNFSCNGVDMGVSLRGLGILDWIFSDSFE